VEGRRGGGNGDGDGIPNRNRGRWRRRRLSPVHSRDGEPGKVTNDFLEVDGSCSSAIIDDAGRQVLHVAAGSGLHAGPSSFPPPWNNTVDK
jgi:hypothetical protein